jgi:mxaK protein
VTGAPLRAARRRGAFFTFLGVFLLALGLLAWSLQGTWRDARINRGLAALAAGRDVAVVPEDPPRLIEARASWLLARDQIEEAEALGPLIAAAGDPRAEAIYHYNRGNARLRRAFERIETRALDAAVPEVTLAKAAYRAALAREPGFFDAKVNLDLAMRLVRDLPREEQEGEEAEAPPKALWTDLPGVPGGAP